MWKKLYSNSGLILLAILAAGVWTSNLYTFIRQSPKLSSTAETQTAPDVRELGRRVKAKYPGAYDDLTDEDLGRRVKAKYPGAYDDFTDTPAADKERLRTLQQDSPLKSALLSPKRRRTPLPSAMIIPTLTAKLGGALAPITAALKNGFLVDKCCGFRLAHRRAACPSKGSYESTDSTHRRMD
jgi:hypothetical protein